MCGGGGGRGGGGDDGGVGFGIEAKKRQYRNFSEELF